MFKAKQSTADLLHNQYQHFGCPYLQVLPSTYCCTVYSHLHNVYTKFHSESHII